ncbi:MAG TPA: hypothetical protein VEA19_00695, partial [Actinomycetota bacterium]|nr:hypothetical protein [Actinomycetota bacterium]
APAGVLRLAQEAGTPAVLISGQIEKGLEVPARIAISLEETAGELCFTQPRQALMDASELAAGELMGADGRIG